MSRSLIKCLRYFNKPSCRNLSRTKYESMPSRFCRPMNATVCFFLAAEGSPLSQTIFDACGIQAMALSLSLSLSPTNGRKIARRSTSLLSFQDDKIMQTTTPCKTNQAVTAAASPFVASPFVVCPFVACPFVGTASAMASATVGVGSMCWRWKARMIESASSIAMGRTSARALILPVLQVYND